MTGTNLDVPGNQGPGWLAVLAGAAELARQIADTDFVPDAYRRKPAQIAACVLYGDELGIGPMTALSKIDVINGRPAPRAELGRALAIAAGHRIWIDKATNSHVIVCGQRRGDEHIHTVAWTMDDAKRAGIIGGAQWRKYPRQMLTARATSELVRTMCPDVLGGVTVFAEEATDGDLDDDTATPAGPPPDTSSTKRKRPPRTAKQPEPTVAEPPNTVDEPQKNAEQARTSHKNAQQANTSQRALPPGPPDDDLLDDDPADDIGDAITRAQMSKLHAGFRDAEITERNDRLAFAAAVIGRPVTSSGQLTKTEAGRVLDTLDALNEGRVTINFPPSGEWIIEVLDPETDS